jgi:hypothetical protein
MSTSRDQLHELVDQLPEEQVLAAVSQLRARLVSVPPAGSWPPTWIGVAQGSSQDLSERFEDVLSAELGEHSA